MFVQGSYRKEVRDILNSNDEIIYYVKILISSIYAGLLLQLSL